MKLQFYAYRDLVPDLSAITLAYEDLTSYVSLNVTLGHLNFGVVLLKTYQCEQCGSLVPVACRCPRCEKLPSRIKRREQ